MTRAGGSPEVTDGTTPETPGLKLGSPCQNEHTIIRDGPRFWMTCGDEQLSERTFHASSLRYDEEPRAWSEGVMARHEIACWKALARDARDELARWGWGDMHYGSQPQERSVVEIVDRINAALREGRFADA